MVTDVERPSTASVKDSVSDETEQCRNEKNTEEKIEQHQSLAEPQEQGHNDQSRTHHYVILFYKYHPLSSERALVELYRRALECLCRSLKLRGRILVGCNPTYQSEGINGTLSSIVKSDVDSFVLALSKYEPKDCNEADEDKVIEDDCILGSSSNDGAIRTFWKDVKMFYGKAQCPPLVMDKSEFKWSTYQGHAEKADSSGQSNEDNRYLFPDLNVKIVSELIGTGGVLASIPIQDTAKGYLTPKEWHERLKQVTNHGSDQANDNDSGTILIDCRNTKEYQIGHFQNAIDPKTTTFGQFPTWVQQHQESLKNKTVMMYCTGGIRCEKASAYIRKQCPSVKEVLHLKGGIHKYLDEFGDGTCGGTSTLANSDSCSLWKGKNFVFDGRGAATAPTMTSASASPISTNEKSTDKKESPSNPSIVGKCIYCKSPYDSFDPHCLCTVCREPTLVCKQCQASTELVEFHCENHFALKSCYFTNLAHFTRDELERQLEELETLVDDIAVGRRYKQRRKTLNKQRQRIQQYLVETTGEAGTAGNGKMSGDCNNASQQELKCRSCGEIGCSGRCWGFHGLKRKRILESEGMQPKEKTKNRVAGDMTTDSCLRDDPFPRQKKSKNNRHLQDAKELQRKREIQELVHLELCRPSCVHWDDQSGIRLPPPCTRVLKSKTKGKWCGKSILEVVRDEFQELAQEDMLAQIIKHGLLRIQRNNEQDAVVIRTLEQAESTRLKNMDVISRVVHWHEPPVHIPNGNICVERIDLPELVRREHDIEGDGFVYVCNKPSSVPVHPAGPYLSNTLTLMTEAQLGLSPKSLVPCHRIDKVTSGLTLMANNVKVARLVQSSIESGGVAKLYLAQVKGKFPAFVEDCKESFDSVTTSNFAKWEWLEAGNNGVTGIVRVDAPIETVDPANGLRSITMNGKSAQSLFHHVSYDPLLNVSTISCSPLTGRSHQLRVHLQWLGFSILNDVQYGGVEDDTTQKKANLGVKRIAESACLTGEMKKEQCLSELDANAACAACRCQQEGADGIVAMFTPAQLLQSGHSICLHAVRYKVPLYCKKTVRKDKLAADKSKFQMDVLDLNVDLPVWARSLGPSELEWLA